MQPVVRGSQAPDGGDARVVTDGVLRDRRRPPEDPPAQRFAQPPPVLLTLPSPRVRPGHRRRARLPLDAARRPAWRAAARSRPGPDSGKSTTPTTRRASTSLPAASPGIHSHRAGGPWPRPDRPAPPPPGPHKEWTPSPPRVLDRTWRRLLRPHAKAARRRRDRPRSSTRRRHARASARRPCSTRSIHDCSRTMPLSWDASCDVSVPRPWSKLKRRGRAAPCFCRAITAFNRLPCSRSQSFNTGNCDRTDSTRLSPAEIPATAVSTKVSAASRPRRRSANAKIVSSSSGGGAAAHGSRSSRNFPLHPIASDVSNAGGDSGTWRRAPPLRMKRRFDSTFASTTLSPSFNSSISAIVSAPRSRKPFGPRSITKPSSTMVRAWPPGVV